MLEGIYKKKRTTFQKEKQKNNICTVSSGGSFSQKIESANSRSAKQSGLTTGISSFCVESAVSYPVEYTGLSWIPIPR
jgi:hypothetical protein